MSTTLLKSASAIALLCSSTSAFPSSQRVSPKTLAHLNNSDHYEKVSNEKTPTVQLTSYLYNFENELVLFTNSEGNQLGITTYLAADIFGSLESPAFRLQTWAFDSLIVNPHLFAEVSAELSFTFKLLLVEATVSLKILGAKVSPLDIQFAADIEKPGNYCYSVGYFQEVMDLLVEVEQRSYECHRGLLGNQLENDPKDCTWRRYQPHLPLYEVSFLDQFDQVRDYVPWTCVDDAQLDTVESGEEAGQIGAPEEHPHGFEPINIPGIDLEDEVIDEPDEEVDPWDVDGTVIIVS